MVAGRPKSARHSVAEMRRSQHPPRSGGQLTTGYGLLTNMNPLQPRLAALRRRLRLVVTFRGVCLFLSLLLASAVLAGWLDWRMPGHLPSLVRALILVISLSGAVVILYRFVLQPLFLPADDLNLALRIEDHYPSLI